MKVLAIGELKRFEELKLKLPEDLDVKHELKWDGKGEFDLIFDLCFDGSLENLAHFASLKNVPVIACAVKRSLSEAVYSFQKEVNCVLIGMNCIPTFIHRDLAEVSIFNKDHDTLEKLMQQLGWKYRLVKDRVGMVTPRIICMIINEACYTLQEGTASIQDIDTAMKLGTNYPYGPFEWADKIGIKDVFEILEAIYHDTKDERYKICPLLKSKYLRGEAFF